MDDTPELDARFVDLEVKLAYLEDLVDSLNALVARQQQQIDALVHELVRLRRQTAAADDPAAPRSLRDEIPPHY
ncbi:MAG TPA: SlyX family protein [Burkholderiaceae bacterium]|nr:SlyX family protein [Burkholderiaceae bacterium]